MTHICAKYRSTWPTFITTRGQHQKSSVEDAINFIIIDIFYCKFVIEISLSSEFFNINDIILTLNQSHHTMLAVVKNNVKKKINK